MDKESGKNHKADENYSFDNQHRMHQGGDDRNIINNPPKKNQICINLSNTNKPFQQKIPVSFRQTDQILSIIQLMGRNITSPFYKIFCSISHTSRFGFNL